MPNNASYPPLLHYVFCCKRTVAHLRRASRWAPSCSRKPGHGIVPVNIKKYCPGNNSPTHDTANNRQLLGIYSQISVIRTSIIRNYRVFWRRWTVPTFSQLSIAIKLPIIWISIIRKNQFFEVIRRSWLKKMLLNYPSRSEVQMSRMVILFGRVRFTHLSDLENR